METIKLPSGKELRLGVAPFADAHKLLKAVSKEAETIKLDLTDIDPIKNFIARMIWSDEIERALRPCIERCNYDKMQITDEIFEDTQNRGDYLAIKKEVMIFNLTPFIGSLGSLFSDIKKTVGAQAQK